MEMNTTQITSFLPVTDEQQEYLYAFGRIKKKRQLKKQYREEGMSRKDARKAAKNTLKDGVKNISAKTTFAPSTTPTEDEDLDELDDLGTEGAGPLGMNIPGEGEDEGVNWLVVGGIGIGVIALAVVSILLMPSKSISGSAGAK